MRNTLNICLDLINASKDPKIESRSTRVKELCAELLVRDNSSQMSTTRKPIHTSGNTTGQCIYVTGVINK